NMRSVCGWTRSSNRCSNRMQTSFSLVHRRSAMLTRFIRLLAVLLALAAAPAWAITLDEAKAQGLVGEKVDGYVAAVAAAVPAEVQALIESTNAGRRQVYADLARRNGI